MPATDADLLTRTTLQVDGSVAGGAVIVAAIALVNVAVVDLVVPNVAKSTAFSSC
jgi:hypothetical protein